MGEITDYNTLIIDDMGKGDIVALAVLGTLNIRNEYTANVKVTNLFDNSEVVLSNGQSRVFTSSFEQHFYISSTEQCNGQIDSPPPIPKLFQENMITFVGTTEDKLQNIKLQDSNGILYPYAFKSAQNSTVLLLADTKRYTIGTRIMNLAPSRYVVDASGTASASNNGQIAVRYKTPIFEANQDIVFTHTIVMGALPEITFSNDNAFAINIEQRDIDSGELVATIALNANETKTVTFVTSNVTVRKQ